MEDNIPTIHSFKLTKEEQDSVKGGLSPLEVAHITFPMIKITTQKIPWKYYEKSGILDIYVSSKFGNETKSRFVSHYIK
jgi:hypothetical protein